MCTRLEEFADELQQIVNVARGSQTQERQRQQKFLIGTSDIFAARSAFLRTKHETDEPV
jgi:hypothetical protein